VFVFESIDISREIDGGDIAAAMICLCFIFCLRLNCHD
jgi:hypothetical protein